MGSKPVTVKQIVKIRKSKSSNSLKNSSPAEDPNCELLLAYYASESSMNKKIKALYETIFAHEELDISQIDLSYMKFDVKCSYHLKIIFHYFINLQDLKLSKIGLNYKNLKRLSRGFPVFTMLLNLNLEGNRLDYQGIALISQYFKHWNKLKVLNLSHNCLDSDAFEFLGNTLCFLKELKELQLNGNYAKDEGAIGLQPGIKNCNKLSVLGLASNNITYDGAKYILCLSGSLEKLDFSNNHISRGLAFLFISKYSKLELIIWWNFNFLLFFCG